MAAPRSRQALRFYRASGRRFEEAQFLFVRGGYTTAAVYLAGYGVECILKALILSREPESRHVHTLGTFRGAHAHAFEWLGLRLSERAVTFPADARKELARITKWTTHLRYDPGTIKPRDAKAFLNAAEKVIQWADGRI